MNSTRFLAVLFALVTAFAVRSTFSQEAVEQQTTTSSNSDATEEASPGVKPDNAAEQKEKAAIKSGKSIEELMTPEEFKSAGLDKLTEDELQHLDAWLQGYRQTAEKRATAAVAKKASEEVAKAKADAARTSKKGIDLEVSRVDGRFPGLTGHTIIKLEDGTVWKQANKEDRYQGPNVDHPLVAIKHSAFGYKMQIEGTPEFYVNPVR
jgi:hypothetical protein